MLTIFDGFINIIHNIALFYNRRLVTIMVQCLKMNKEQKDGEITNSEILSAFEGEYVNSITLSLVKDAGWVALQVRNQGLESQEKSSKEDLLTNGDTEVTRKIKPQLQSIF